MNTDEFIFDRPVKTSKSVKKNIQSFKYAIENQKDELKFLVDSNIYSTSRSIEDVDYIDENVICTTYFSSKIDPQRKIKICRDNIEYIKPWYDSLRKLNLFGIVFYDNLSHEFINKYQTTNIKFVKCVIGNYSLNDERFIIYYMFFLKYKVKNVLFTDGNDVVINRDPFNLIESKKNKIFIGRGKENKIYQSKWNLNSIDRFLNSLEKEMPNNFYEMAIYNAGIIGGEYCNVLFFLRQICFLFFKIDNENNNNMAAMHYVLYSFYYPNCRKVTNSFLYNFMSNELKIKLLKRFKYLKIDFLLNDKINYSNDTTALSRYIFSGFPLNSKFYKYEKDSKAYLIHK